LVEPEIIENQISEIENDGKTKKRKNCEYCIACCKNNLIKCYSHKTLISEINLSLLKLETYTIIIHDFEFIKNNKKLQILEYGAIKINSNNNIFKKEKICNNLIYPTSEINFNSYAIKNVNHITKDELFNKSILVYEVLYLLNIKLDKNIIFISSSCTNELNCFNELLNLMDKAIEIDYLAQEEYYRILSKENLENKDIKN
jgi:hypothetical protein